MFWVCLIQDLFGRSKKKRRPSILQINLPNFKANVNVGTCNLTTGGSGFLPNYSSVRASMKVNCSLIDVIATLNVDKQLCIEDKCLDGQGNVSVKWGTAGAAVNLDENTKMAVSIKTGVSTKGNVKFEITKTPKPS